jgi:hypothetical protein
MSTFTGKGLLAVGFLAGLAAIQGGIAAGWSEKRSEPDQNWVTAGESLRGLTGWDEEGHAVALGSGHSKVLLVTSTECPHTAAVEGAWTRWIQKSLGEQEAVFLSMEGKEIPAPFLELASDRRGVSTLTLNASSTLARRVSRRTPWVFFLDAEGVVLAEGHGAQIQELATQEVPPRENVP